MPQDSIPTIFLHKNKLSKKNIQIGKEIRTN